MSIDKSDGSVDKKDFARLQQCVCGNIRRTGRAVTQFYDAILAPSGLHITQFVLLAALADSTPMTINRLAEFMVMDRTTLTRNLRPLIKQGWILMEEGEDRRMHFAKITAAGKETLIQAQPFWEQAQAHMIDSLGQGRIDALRAELAAVVSVSQ